MTRKLILVTALSTLFFSCSAPSQIVSSWRAPSTSITNPSIHKIVVAAIINDPVIRRQIEDYMASLYPGTATPSYIAFGPKPLDGNEEAFNQELNRRGYDGIVLLRQTNETINQHYVPGKFPSYYQTWGGYWRHGWGVSYYNPGTPGHIATNRTWVVQVTVYSVQENKLIWAADTRTTNPGGRVPLFQDVCNAVRKQMKSDGFLK